MKNDQTVRYRKDYTVPLYLIDKISLEFVLHPKKTKVKTTTHFIRNTASKSSDQYLILNGENLTLDSICINGETLDPTMYKVDSDSLTIFQPKNDFLLEIETSINPEANSELSGLYLSGGIFCTQCEAEGFRRITYFLDRPDVLAVFDTRITADCNLYPVLLSNGNCVDRGMIDNGMHFVHWEDPYPKPCYLFALVAGDLHCNKDQFTTSSGRTVSLEIYVEKENSTKCDHAMQSLKKAMAWDERVFGLEYDLNTYMIVAVNDFNMGAMENKGLNIFNSKYVLALPDTATDQDYLGIEGVIAHEYFHNWTGNRVTCRDWFQLSLKEGLTVFRDQEFSSDMNSRAVKRIHDVNILRNHQFREDIGPMAHPVRPDSYVEINNFYTVTVYNKGAEVVRMLYILIGEHCFRKGMDIYFQRFDGQAVTCDDFVHAMEDASGVDLSQFKRWYSQAGTPELHVSSTWREQTNEYEIFVRQSCKPTPEQPEKLPFHLPVKIGIIVPDRDGNKLAEEYSHTIEIKKKEQRFTFGDIQSEPILSFLRDFSAPVKIHHFQTNHELAFLLAHDSDPFNRWEAAQKLAMNVIQGVIGDLENDRTCHVPDLFVEAIRESMEKDVDHSLLAQIMTLPSETYIAQQQDVIKPFLLHKAVSIVRQALRKKLYDLLREVYERNSQDERFDISPSSMGRRSLKNCCLSYLVLPDVATSEDVMLCREQFFSANNMTDRTAALAVISHCYCDERDEAMDNFFANWCQDSLVLDKWFLLQATSTREDTLEKVKKLIQHESFSIKNPNRVRSLVGGFCGGNHVRFHDDSGAGYRFLTDIVLRIDKLNPQISARLVLPMIHFSSYQQKLRMLMEEQLRFIQSQDSISTDLKEIVQKSLHSIHM